MHGKGDLLFTMLQYNYHYSSSLCMHSQPSVLMYRMMQLAAVIRELAASQRLSDDFVDDVLLNCCSIKSLIQSCAELLRVVPNPRTHPFMEILQVITIHVIMRLNIISKKHYRLSPLCRHFYIYTRNHVELKAL